MKIAFVLNDLSNSGTNVAAFDLIKQMLSEYDVDINIFFLRNCKDELPFDKTRVFKLKFSGLSNLNSFDIIYSSNLKSDFILFFSKIIFKKRNSKYVSAIHCIIKEDLEYTYGKLISRIFSPVWLYIKKKNDGLIVANSMEEYYYKKIKNVDYRIIQYGRSIEPSIKVLVPQKEEVKLQSLKSKYKLFGTVGALISRKNYKEAVKLLKKYDNLVWVCLGIGEEYRNLYDLIVLEKLEYLGQKSDSRIYYKFFDFFFHPSKSEGFPLVLIDSFSHKIPVLLSRLEVYKSLLNENMVYYFQLDDDNSLFNACDMILQYPNSVEESVKLCYEFYIKELSIEKNTFEHFSYFNYLNESKINV